MSDSEDEIPLARRIPTNIATASNSSQPVAVVSNVVPKPAHLGASGAGRDANGGATAAPPKKDPDAGSGHPTSNGQLHSDKPSSSQQGKAGPQLGNGHVESHGAGKHSGEGKALPNGVLPKLENGQEHKGHVKAPPVKAKPGEEPPGPSRAGGTTQSVVPKPKAILAPPAVAKPKPSAEPAKAAKPKPPATSIGAAKAQPPPPAAASSAQPQANGAPQGVKASKKRVLESDSDSEDDVPLGARIQQVAKKPALAVPRPPEKKKAPAPVKAKKRKEREDDTERASRKTKSFPDKRPGTGKESTEIKWTTLVHNGVLFPPDYVPHGVKMLYDGRPVDLNPAQEEVATLFAAMKDTDYMKKPMFLKNSWAAFRGILGKNHVIASLEKCDFTPIYEHLLAQKEVKKGMSKEEKLRIKTEKDEAEAKYKFALVDGRKEQVGNFRVEPPGLFRGRGEHPRMGMLKRRIYPRDITINIGKDAPVPEHPYEGQQWKEVRHDNTVTWLAFWKEPIAEKDYKYVWLAANSTFKSDSDLAKYEKARRLKDVIGKIREDYERDWHSKSIKTRQMGVALYFIDKLALRAGHEKDEDEADTVGCCTLKVENVETIEPDHIKFDFLGKDSIRYENTVQVHKQVFALVEQFCKRDQHNKTKRPEDQLFDSMDAMDLNKKLRDLMDGLSVKVFRTYNASITLDDLLSKHSSSVSVEEKKADYDRANKEVAILCNHQRAVPKGHAGQMEKMEAKLLELQGELNDMEAELEAAEKGKAYKKPGETPSKKVSDPEAVRKRIEKKKEQLAKHELQAKVKEDLKTVALGTSKINYLDPRITVAWCKLHEVPMEKIFQKTLLSKFHWAMDTEPEFRF